MDSRTFKQQWRQQGCPPVVGGGNERIPHWPGVVYPRPCAWRRRRAAAGRLIAVGMILGAALVTLGVILVGSLVRP